MVWHICFLLICGVQAVICGAVWQCHFLVLCGAGSAVGWSWLLGIDLW